MTSTRSEIPGLSQHLRVTAENRWAWVPMVLFTATAFVGATLLFTVQPMVTRLLLPSYGGSATVWSTSSLFFQGALLLGYVYAHLSTRRLGHRSHPPFHLLVLLLTLTALPIALPNDPVPPDESSPIVWLLRTLLVTVGLPFSVLSTTGPLLQRWYSWAGGPRASDPYFLFAASNLGSFGGLLLYPFVIEPRLTLDHQRSLWSWGFVAFIALTASCGLVTFTARRSAATLDEPVGAVSLAALGLKKIARWTLLAFIPSALMLAVTSHISTDIAAIPLLWVVPLAIYLASFVAAFARTTRSVPRWVSRAALWATLLAAVMSSVTASMPIMPVIMVQMLMLALVGYACHSHLAAERPEVQYLTAFYLVVAAGGAFGGLLNGVIAPLVFDRAWEYVLMLVLVPLAIGQRTGGGGIVAEYASRGWVAKVIAVLAGTLAFVLPWLLLGVASPPVAVGVALFALTTLLAWLLSSSRAVASALISVVALVSFAGSTMGSVEHSRTFYGTYRVTQIASQRTLVHGTTVHGSQWGDERRFEPTTYYARSGPLGALFDTQDVTDVGVIGLGVGTVAAYGEPSQKFTFIEIDAEVERIARDPRLFTYLADTPARVEVTVGDGRIEIGKIPENSLDLLIVDAFSSDAIPVHLLTVEAMQTYVTRLRAGGRLAVHVSNRVFDLRPVLRGSADDLGWVGLIGRGGEGQGATASEWIVLAANRADLSALARRSEWEQLPSRSVVWTDNFSSILSVLR